nr:hypothetical protein CFP56_40694 [Quercus suber]
MVHHIVKSLVSSIWILKELETCADKSMEFCCFLALIIFHSKIKPLSSDIDPLRGMSSFSSLPCLQSPCGLLHYCCQRTSSNGWSS